MKSMAVRMILYLRRPRRRTFYLRRSEGSGRASAGPKRSAATMGVWIGLAALLGWACAPLSDEARIARASGDGTLLVANKGEDTVSFIDLATGRELSREATGPAPHELALSPDGSHAAVVAYAGRSIDIFDIASRTRLRTIDLAPNENPHGIVWLHNGRVIVTTEGTESLTIVDTGREDRIESVRTGQPGTHMVAVTPDGRRAFTANRAAGTVSVIDLDEGRKLRDIAVGGRPEGIALTRDGRTLWVGDLAGARVLAYRLDTFELLAEVRTGEIPIRVAASPDGRWIVISNYGSGSLTVIDAATRRAVREIELGATDDAGPVTILFSHDGRLIYVAEPGHNRIAEVEFASGRVLRRLQSGMQGDGLAITR